MCRDVWTKPVTVAVLFACALALLVAQPAAAKEREQKTRSVQGIVTDEQENPIARAVVQLKNMKTLGVKSFYSTDKGAYHFQGLDPDIDYEVKAEYGSATDGPRKITPFDSRREIVINFKLAVKK
jgi:hypothetical protein